MLRIRIARTKVLAMGFSEFTTLIINSSVKKGMRKTGTRKRQPKTKPNQFMANPKWDHVKAFLCLQSVFMGRWKLRVGENVGRGRQEKGKSARRV